MSRGGVRLLRIGAVLVPLALLFLLLHHVAPGIQKAYRAAGLPEDYDLLAESGNYVLYGRPGDQEALQAGKILDRFTEEVRREYSRPMHLEPSDARIDVIIFGSHEDFRSYGRAELGEDLERNGGFYLPAAGAIAVINSGDFGGLVSALFHEGTHMMLDRWVEGTDHRWSLWLNEGLATWFEGSKVTDAGVRIGGVPPQLIRHLRQDMARGEWVTVGDLVSATHEDFMGSRNRSYYAASCLLVDHLLRGESGSLRECFFRYFDVERRPGPVSPFSFRDIIGETGAVDAALKRHLWN